MSEVKRYSVVCSPERIRMEIDSDEGMWVAYSDYAKLEAERDRLRMVLKVDEEERDRLWEALDKFGEHYWNCYCKKPTANDSDCTCGLNKALRVGGDG